MEKNHLFIVLADDDFDDRLFFTDAFSELKIATKIQTCNDGAALMEYLQNDENLLPDILFLDLNMPKKNGLECLKEIKANTKFQSIAIAIYSTSSSEEHIEETFVLGANVYIKKPADFNELKSVLNEVVTRNWQYQTSGLNKENFLLRL